MSTETPTILHDLLNRIEAIIECGAGTITELAKHIYPNKEVAISVIRVSEWVKSRRRTPMGETALQMKEWASRKELDITKNRQATKYRTAYKAVLKRRATPATSATK